MIYAAAIFGALASLFGFLYIRQLLISSSLRKDKKVLSDENETFRKQLQIASRPALSPDDLLGRMRNGSL